MGDLLSLFNAFAAGFCFFGALLALRDGHENTALLDFLFVLLNIVLIIIRIPH